MSLAGIEIIGAAGCPYVQRVVSLLVSKSIPFTYQNVDLQNKPAWFLEKSPLGKVPVLRYPTDGKFVFESLIIAELIDDLLPAASRVSPSDPLLKAQNKAWIEYFGSIFVDLFGALAKPTKEEFEAATDSVAKKFQVLENEIKGPYFNGEKISLVDIASAPFAQRLKVFDEWLKVDLGNKQKLPKVTAYLATLRALPSNNIALILQAQKDASLDSLKEIKQGERNAEADARAALDIIDGQRAMIAGRFSKSYAVTLLA